MAVRYRHTWGATAFVVATLLCLQADAKGRGPGVDVPVTGPGGESVIHTNSNQVQIWSCQGGKMNGCIIRSEGGTQIPLVGRSRVPSQKLHLKMDYTRQKRMALARHKH